MPREAKKGKIPIRGWPCMGRIHVKSRACSQVMTTLYIMKLGILKRIGHLFTAEKVEYWHRDRSIEIIAAEKNIDIRELELEVLEMLRTRGRVHAIESIRHRFHVPLSSAWRFINRLDAHSSQ